MSKLFYVEVLCAAAAAAAAAAAHCFLLCALIRYARNSFLSFIFVNADNSELKISNKKRFVDRKKKKASLVLLQVVTLL